MCLSQHLIYINTAPILRLILEAIEFAIQLGEQPRIFLQALGHYKRILFLSLPVQHQLLLLVVQSCSLLRV